MQKTRWGVTRRGEDPIVRPPSWGGSEAYRNSIGIRGPGQEKTRPRRRWYTNRAGCPLYVRSEIPPVENKGGDAEDDGFEKEGGADDPGYRPIANLVLEFDVLALL